MAKKKKKEDSDNVRDIGVVEAPTQPSGYILEITTKYGQVYHIQIPPDQKDEALRAIKNEQAFTFFTIDGREAGVGSGGSINNWNIMSLEQLSALRAQQAQQEQKAQPEKGGNEGDEEIQMGLPFQLGNSLKEVSERG